MDGGRCVIVDTVVLSCMAAVFEKLDARGCLARDRAPRTGSSFSAGGRSSMSISQLEVGSIAAAAPSAPTMLQRSAPCSAEHRRKKGGKKRVTKRK